MIHPIAIYGDPILRKKSVPVKGNVNRMQLKTLIDDMFETMHKANGIGLSAIQIKIPLRIFVIEAHLEEEDFHMRETFINPVVKPTTAETVRLTEGCLSIPGISAMVDRPTSVEITYLDADLKQKKKKFDGYAARIIQHEYDHLNGVLFLDDMDLMWKSMLEPSLRLIEEGKIRPQYMTAPQGDSPLITVNESGDLNVNYDV